MKRVVLTCVVSFFFAMPCGAANDPLSVLDFLLGKWSGNTAGTVGTDVFQKDLDGRVLQRRSQSIVAASEGRPQSSMQAQLTIYATVAGGDALAAIYFDNEGHVIHYDHIRVTPGQQVELLSESHGPGPGFRLTYTLKTRTVLHVKFEMALPGQSDYRLIAEADEAATS